MDTSDRGRNDSSPLVGLDVRPPGCDMSYGCAVSCGGAGGQWWRSRAPVVLPLLALWLGCAPPPIPPEPATAASPGAPAMPGAAAATCVDPQIVDALACPEDAPPPLAAPAPLTWPSGAHLFTYPAPGPWRRLVDPRVLAQAARHTVSVEGFADERADKSLGLLDEADRASRKAWTTPGQWESARKGYAGFLQASAAEHPLRAYALQRHARALWNLGKPDAALAETLALLRHLRTHPNTAGAKDLREIARADIGGLYAASTRKPEDAHTVLEGLFEDQKATYAWMELVAEGYLDAVQYDGARAVFGDLVKRHSAAQRCVFNVRRTAVSVVEDPADVRGLRHLIDEQLALQQEVEGGDATRAEKQGCRDATSAQMVQLAIAWQVQKPPPRKRPPRLHTDGTSVSGNAVPEEVFWVVRLHAGQLQACYQAALRRDPFLEAKQSLHFVIERDGTTTKAGSDSAYHSDEELNRCLIRVVDGLRFAQPEGGIVDVWYPLKLSRERGVQLAAEPRIGQP